MNDPITLEIIRNWVQATADEMFAAMRKTAMSSITYEVLDMGTGITDAQGASPRPGRVFRPLSGCWTNRRSSSCRNSAPKFSPAMCSSPMTSGTAG